MPGINPEPGAIEGLGLTPNQALSRAGTACMHFRKLLWLGLAPSQALSRAEQGAIEDGLHACSARPSGGLGRSHSTRCDHPIYTIARNIRELDVARACCPLST